MQAGALDPKLFPYATKDPELLATIAKYLKAEETPLASRAAKLSDAGQGISRAC